MSTGFFITGTDTGVGKTLVSAALVHAYATRGWRALGMKPVAAGCELKSGALLSEDVAQLIAASNVKAALELVNPYTFEPAIAPHIAAAQANVKIDLEVIQQAYQQLDKLADVLVVEGVGGFCVPLSAHTDTAHLAKQLDLPIIMVVGMRLGCLNHALLTVGAIESRGLKLAGWVANRVDPQMLMYQQNFDSLQQRLPAPCLGIIPWLPKADFTQAATCLDLNLLQVNQALPNELNAPILL